MTHASNISIPARFVFRPYRVKWEITWASIVGWGELTRLMAFQAIGDGKATLDPDFVVIRVALRRIADGSDKALGILSGLYGPGGQYDSFEVKVKRAYIPPECLGPSENPDTTPDIGGREFDLLACRLPPVDGLGAFWQPGELESDAWAMREQFFALGDNVHDAFQFLNRWGLWNLEPVYEESSPYISGSLKMRAFAFSSPHRLWALRDSYIKAAAGSPRAWLTTATPLSLKETDRRPYFMIERSYCEDAIKATITIDHLSKVKFGICKRHDCRKLFKRTTAQKRLYCTPYCAHISNVRKLRKTKSKSTEKGTKKNAEG